MAHFRECVEIIEEVEADKKGTVHSKVLNMNEKYKMGLIYMKMLDNPDKFKYIERCMEGQDSKTQSKMSLPPADLAKYIDLMDQIESNEVKKDGFRMQRRLILEEVRHRSI